LIMKAKIYGVNAFKDPISAFLFSKWQHYFALLLIFFFLQMMVSFFSGTLIEIEDSIISEVKVFSSNEIATVSTVKDLPIFFTYLVAISLFFFIRRFLLHTPRAFETLFNNGVFKEKKGSTHENLLSDYNESLQEFENTINARTMYIIAFLLHFVVIANFLILRTPIPDLEFVLWYNFDFFPLNWIALNIVAPLMWFLAGILIWKMYCVISFTRKVTRQYEFGLNPRNNDGFGGFKPLSQLWINIALVIVPILLYHTAIFVYNLCLELSYLSQQKYIDLAIIISYTIVVIILLIYPMKEYHDIVETQKVENFRRVNAEINRLWKIVREPLLTGKDEDLVKNSEEELECYLRSVHKVKRIPSWPFTPSERVGVLMIAIIPWILETIRYLIRLLYL
jgi:hypothetical protein